MARYYFNSRGGCERCDAMDGVTEFEPHRPHPGCDCEIGHYDERQCARFDTEIVSDNFPGPGSGEDHEITMGVTVTCCNGETHEIEITKAWRADTVDDEREAQHELMDEMEMAAEWLLQNNCIGLA